MGRIVIACYRPKPGKSSELRHLLRTHVERLRVENLVTAREPILMESDDGTFVEVFEWLSKDAIDAAHTNPRVQKMWAEYSAVCEYVPVSPVPEGSDLFSAFRPVNFDG